MSSNPIIHVIIWIIEVETIKWQTRDTYGCFVAGQSPWAQAWTVAYRL